MRIIIGHVTAWSDSVCVEVCRMVETIKWYAHVCEYYE